MHIFPATIPPMAKVILAGGSGFLGRALARALCAQGWEVVVLTRDTDRVPPADDLPAGCIATTRWRRSRQPSTGRR